LHFADWQEKMGVNEQRQQEQYWGASTMAKILIKCLETGHTVQTGMVTDEAAWGKLAADWAGDRFLCPACNRPHAWLKSDAFLERAGKATVVSLE
jgi:hypothetical protein